MNEIIKSNDQLPETIEDLSESNLANEEALISTFDESIKSFDQIYHMAISNKGEKYAN